MVEEVLSRIGGDYNTDAARRLILGTMAVESNLKYLYQVGGPARGLVQMEPATALDIYRNYIRYRLDRMRGAWTLRGAFRKATGLRVGDVFSSAERVDYHLAASLGLQVFMCRIHYYRVPAALPQSLEDQAAYWKQWYNTAAGAGDPAEFIARYNRFFGAGG